MKKRSQNGNPAGGHVTRSSQRRQCSMGSELRTSFNETASGHGNGRLVSRAETATAALIPWKHNRGPGWEGF